MSKRSFARLNHTRRDANEIAIVDALRKRGFSVHRISAPGFPDLVVTKRGVPAGTRSVQVLTSGTDALARLESIKGGVDSYFAQVPLVWFVEVKQPKGKLSKAQIEFRESWQGPEIHVLRSIEDAIAFPTGASPSPARPEE